MGRQSLHFLGKHAEARPADDAARRAWRSAPIFTRALCGPQGKLAKRKRRGGRGPPPSGLPLPKYAARVAGVAVAQICGAGRGPLAYLDGCPCSASPVSAAGSGSAAQPPLGQRSVKTGPAGRSAEKVKPALPPQPACKKQTAFLLRLADFRGAGRCPLAKTGALRQARLAASAAGSASACLPQAAR